MRLATKAFYNLLRQRQTADPSIQAEPWQVEDYRDLSTHELFQRLTALGLDLSEENFLLYAENAKSPEQLTDLLWTKNENRDPVYLLVFELWRRLLPEKVSLSSFCDELDYRIGLYEKDPVQYKSSIENVLLKLEELLDENVDAGKNPTLFFQSLSFHCTHEPETFLYEFITDQIETHEELYAAELIESFRPFISDAVWFDFAQARIVATSDPHEANIIFKSILDELKEEPDVDILLEIATFLVSHGDPHLFYQAARQAFEIIHTEEDFQELLAIVANYCRCCEMEKEEKKIKDLFARRTAKDPDAALDKSDKDLNVFESLLSPNLLPEA